MKKLALLLLVSLLITVTVLQISPAYAISTGWERYKDDICEIYLEYFPTFPFDPYHPTANEEFAIKFYIVQEAFWENVVYKFVPDGFMIRVGFRDVTDGSLNWTEFKLWYPISMKQHGLDIAWRLMVGGEGLSFGATVNVPDTRLFSTDFTKEEWVYDGDTYMFLSLLDVYYNSNTFWGQTYCEGGGSINIPNDLAMNKDGHHVEVLVEVTVYWMNYIIIPIFKEEVMYFVLGDDDPATTDCWLTVEEGTVAFGENPSDLTISAGTGGTTDPSPGTYVYDEGTSVEVTATAGSGYSFDYWVLDGAAEDANPITVTMNSDHNLEAYFSDEGTLGCPTLFVWSGTGYADEGILDIHADSDVTVRHEIETPLELEDGGYRVQLRELDNFTSHIDQVRLYAVDDEGEEYLCPLTHAYHSELDNVKHTLRFDDDARVDLKPTERIDLRFGPPECQIEHFIFEINGYNPKPLEEAW